MKVGQRSKIIINEIDLIILNILLKKQIGIMELKESSKLAHNSLKPHIGRLENLKLIELQPVEKSRKILLKITKNGGLLLSILK